MKGALLWIINHHLVTCNLNFIHTRVRMKHIFPQQQLISAFILEHSILIHQALEVGEAFHLATSAESSKCIATLF